MNNEPRQKLDAAHFLFFTSILSFSLLISILSIMSLSSNRMYPRLNPFLSEALDKSRENRQDDSKIAFPFDKSGLSMYNINNKSFF